MRYGLLSGKSSSRLESPTSEITTPTNRVRHILGDPKISKLGLACSRAWIRPFAWRFRMRVNSFETLTLFPLSRHSRSNYRKTNKITFRWRARGSRQCLLTSARWKRRARGVWNFRRLRTTIAPEDEPPNLFSSVITVTEGDGPSRRLLSMLHISALPRLA